jgi:hypothetical protein
LTWLGWPVSNTMTSIERNTPAVSARFMGELYHDCGGRQCASISVQISAKGSLDGVVVPNGPGTVVRERPWPHPPPPRIVRMRTVRMVAATGIRTRQNRSFVSRPATLGAGPLDYKVANGPVKPRTAFSVPGDRPPRSYGVRGRSIAGQHLSGKGAFRQSGITIASAGFLKRWATRRDLLLRTPGSGLPAGPKYEMDLRSVEGGSADPSPFPRLI